MRVRVTIVVVEKQFVLNIPTYCLCPYLIYQN